MQATINLRLDGDLKTSLLGLAELDGYSLSDYIREILLNHLDNFSREKLTKEEERHEIDDEDFQEIDLSKQTPYERTYEFTCLIVWIFCRKMHPQDANSINALTSLKYKVENVLENSSFSSELKSEFLKILSDLNRFLLEPEYQDKQFIFCVPGNHLSFNYYLLINEIWSLETKLL